MTIDLRGRGPAFLDFWRERHLCSLTTVRPDGTAHVVPVGVTLEPEAGIARVITFRASRKVALVSGRVAGDAASVPTSVASTAPEVGVGELAPNARTPFVEVEVSAPAPFPGQAAAGVDGSARPVGSVGEPGGVGSRRGVPVAVCQVDGGRWSTLEGLAVVRTEPEVIADAVRRYAERYRLPKANPERVVLEIEITRVLGSV